jgi:6-phosphofructokinase 1
MHPSFYDPLRMRPSALGIDYLQTIFGTALGDDDCEAAKMTFAPGNLTEPYHSVNTDVNKRIRYL